MDIDLTVAFAWYVVFLLSTTLHEAAHAWAGMKGGDLTAYAGGQVSLDPMPHIRREPFGMVVMPLIAVVLMGWPLGFASAPYDPLWADRHPKRAALMSLAGPASNFLLCALAFGALKLGIETGWFAANRSFGDFTQLVLPLGESIWVQKGGMILSMFLVLNLLLGVFNLMPVPPLDGSGALPLVLGDRLGRQVTMFLRQPMLGLVGLLVAWKVFPVIFYPVFGWVRWLLIS